MGGRRGQNYRNLGVRKWPIYRFLLYSSVYIFWAERSAPGPPILDPFLTKVQPICGEWHFYRGRFWGSESVKFLQKSAKFQKIYENGPPGPPDPKLTIFDIFDPPMAYQILTTFWAIYERHFSTPKSIIFNQFITTSIFDIFGTNFSSIFNAKFQ
jgi:hypothetical protein